MIEIATFDFTDIVLWNDIVPVIAIYSLGIATSAAYWYYKRVLVNLM